jgi:hypothetical protein
MDEEENLKKRIEKLEDELYNLRILVGAMYTKEMDKKE